MVSHVDVSVVIPVHNTLSYLPRCFDSVSAQTLGQDRIEVIAVDDGSTDGSGAWLDAWAAGRPNATVIHRPASGGAGRPRNEGIESAVGTYLFFLDSDDHLGSEALERLVAMADEQSSDIVYGRIVGSGGRPAPVDLRTTNPDVSVFESPVYWNLAAYKLWRRTLIDAHGLRFTEGRLVNEDLPFAVPGLLNASKVSVVADYDCYYLEGREDGSNATCQDLDWPEQLRFVATVFDLVAAHVPAGPERDRLMQRHLHGEVLAPFGPHYLARDEGARAAMAAAASPLVERWLTDRILPALPPGLRLRAHMLRSGDLAGLTEVVAADAAPEGVPTVVVGGQAYADYPGFRDPAVGLPDSLFDITAKVVLRQEVTDVRWAGPVLRLTGRARLAGLGPGPARRTGILLRQRDSTYLVPAESDEDGRYRCALDMGRAADGGPLPEGIWTMQVTVDADGLRKDAWLPRPTDGAADAGACAPRLVDRGGDAGTTAVAVFHSEAHEHMNLDVGATRHPLGGDVRGSLLKGALGRRPTAETTATLPGIPEQARIRTLLTAPGRAPVLLPTRTDRDPVGRVKVRSALPGLAAGTWDLKLRLEAGGFVRDLPVAGPDGAPLRMTVRPSPLRRLVGRVRRVRLAVFSPKAEGARSMIPRQRGPRKMLRGEGHRS